MVAHPESNTHLISARQYRKSKKVPNACMSRGELAEAVNKFMHERDPLVTPVTYRTISRLEQGRVRWPRDLTREALRAVLGAKSDAELGFYDLSRPTVVPLASSVKLDDARSQVPEQQWPVIKINIVACRQRPADQAEPSHQVTVGSNDAVTIRGHGLPGGHGNDELHEYPPSEATSEAIEISLIVNLTGGVTTHADVSR